MIDAKRHGIKMTDPTDETFKLAVEWSKISGASYSLSAAARWYPEKFPMWLDQYTRLFNHFRKEGDGVLCYTLGRVFPGREGLYVVCNYIKAKKDKKEGMLMDIVDKILGLANEMGQSSPLFRMLCLFCTMRSRHRKFKWKKDPSEKGSCVIQLKDTSDLQFLILIDYCVKIALRDCPTVFAESDPEHVKLFWKVLCEIVNDKEFRSVVDGFLDGMKRQQMCQCSFCDAMLIGEW